MASNGRADSELTETISPDRSSIVTSIKTPLGLVVLLVLVIEGTLLALIPLTTGLDRTLIVLGVVFGLVALVVGAVYYLLRQGKVAPGLQVAGEAADGTQEISGRLICEVRDLYSGEQYMDTVRFGVRISRVLWLSGRYNERIAIGKLIEDSAARLEMPEEQVQALVDDIGWTCFLAGDVDLAKSNIAHGIALAAKNRLFYWAAKGERHLAGISDRHDGDLEEATKHIKEARKFAESLPEGEQRQETFGGLSYAMAELNLSLGHSDQALECCIEAKRIYEAAAHERDRAVKIHSQMGRIYLARGDTRQSRDHFRRGLECSKQISRPDEQATNLLGLGQVYLQEQNYSLAASCLEEAEGIFKEIGMRAQARICDDTRRKVNEKLSP